MKANKKTLKKKQLSPNTSRLRKLLLLLVIVTAILVGYVLKDYNPTLQKEAEGFTQLKQDFLELQKEFNTIDQGWTYSEGCRGKGGVYNDDEASSCRLLLTSPESNDYTLLQQHFETYVQIISHRDGFAANDTTKEIRWSLSNAADKTTISSRMFSKENWQDTNCSLHDFFSSDKSKGGIQLECNHSSSFFRYPRYDK